ncbi:MAG: inositol monophosphatase family protein, partial [Aeromicrobium sp.]
MHDLTLAQDLVTRAGALAASMRRAGLDAEQKTSISDVVTDADHAAEALVTESLQRERPDDGLLGEEGTERTGTSGRRWVIDPVDGTYNFLSGLAYWCSALALEDAGSPALGPVLGAVHQPAADETWLGGRDHPTTLNGTAVAPLVDRPLNTCSLATYVHPSTLQDPDVREVWMAVVGAVATPRILGSGSCDLAGVAGGRVGVWAQHSVPAWDWLPGQA